MEARERPSSGAELSNRGRHPTASAEWVCRAFSSWPRPGEETGLPVVTEVMAPEDVGMVAQYADMLQIGTRNAQNFNLLDEVGKLNKLCF